MRQHSDGTLQAVLRAQRLTLLRDAPLTLRERLPLSSGHGIHLYAGILCHMLPRLRHVGRHRLLHHDVKVGVEAANAELKVRRVRDAAEDAVERVGAERGEARVERRKRRCAVLLAERRRALELVEL